MVISGLKGKGAIFNTPTKAEANPFSSGGKYSTNPQSQKGSGNPAYGGRGSGGGSQQQSQAEADRKLAEERARVESENKKIEAEKQQKIKEAFAIQQQQSNAFVKFRQEQQVQETATKKFAVYDPRFSGVVTSDGKVYRTNNKNFMPKGYEQGQGYSTKEGVAIGGIPKVRSGGKQQEVKPATQPKPTLKEKAIAITGIPGQYLGTIFNKQINTELAERGAKGNFIQRFGTFLNPKYQYDIALYNEQLRTAQLSSRDTFKSLIISETAFNSGKITAEQYNAEINKAMSRADVQLVTEIKSDTMQGIANSNLSEKQKFGLSATVRVAQTIPYFNPATRIIVGADMSREGLLSYSLAETKGQKALSVGQTALGGVLAYSGVKSTFFPKSSGVTFNVGSYGKAVKYGLYAGGTAIAGGVSYLDYSQTLKSTGSQSVALGSAFGTGATLIGGMVAPKVYQAGKDYLSTRNLVELKTPTFESKPFVRETTGGDKQLVFYERTKGKNVGLIDLSLPKLKETLQSSEGNIRNTNPTYGGGRFLKRTYRIIDPLVEARLQGLKEVTYYDLVGNEVKQVSGSTKPFPYADPKEHLKYFKQQKGNVAQYYLPKKFLSKESLQGQQGFGFTATQGKFVETPFLNKYQKYFSGKGVSAYFFRMGAEESVGAKIQLGGVADLGAKPRLYSAYFKKININPGKEIKIPNPLEADGKEWKQYQLSTPGKAGELNLPLYKREVEGVIFGQRTPLGEQYYFKLLGRKIPIEQGIYSPENQLSQINLKGSKVSEGSSYLPSSSYVPSISSKVSLRTSRANSNYSFNKVSSYSFGGGKSAVSVVGFSSIVKPSKVSAGSRVSSVSKVSSKSITETPYNYNPTSRVSSPPSPYKYKYKTGISTTLNPPTPFKNKGRLFGGGFKTSYKQQTIKSSFSVFLRRRGKFRQIGTSESLSGAFGIGKEKARTTLGRTFKVSGDVRGLKTPEGFYTKVTKKGEVVFIQKAKFSLGSSGEKSEIKQARRKELLQ